MKHTKGDWFAKEGQIYPIETGKTLALIPYFDKDDKEQEANAKLIAAAPDLLEACKMALEMYRDIEPAGGWQAVEDYCQDAIRKATE